MSGHERYRRRVAKFQRAEPWMLGVIYGGAALAVIGVFALFVWVGLR